MVWNKIYRREVFQNLRFVDMLCEDAQIMLSLIEKSKSIIYVPDVMYYYRRRKSGIMNGKQDDILKSFIKLIREHMDRLKEANKMKLFSLAQKLLMSKIVENYCLCVKETRKSIRKILKVVRKGFREDPQIEWKIKLKYLIASRIPYVYGKYYTHKNLDENTFWE